MYRLSTVSLFVLMFVPAFVPGPGPSAAVLGTAGPSAAALPDAAGPGPPVVTYRAPVEPVEVVRGFEPPPAPYAAGHRGVDLAVSAGQLVRAAGPGVVSFAGSVAGRGVVVIAHPDGISTEYEPVRPSVAAGDPVAAGRPIGRVDGTHGGCAPGACLHWGARRGGSYFDPLSLLRPLGPVRLLPWIAATR